MDAQLAAVTSRYRGCASRCARCATGGGGHVSRWLLCGCCSLGRECCWCCCDVLLVLTVMTLLFVGFSYLVVFGAHLPWSAPAAASAPPLSRGSLNKARP